MELLIKRKTPEGKILFETVTHVESVVVFDDVRAIFQIENDFKVVKPVKGSKQI